MSVRLTFAKQNCTRDWKLKFEILFELAIIENLYSMGSGDMALSQA